MKLLKSAVVAVSLALSLGSFSTTAVACEDGRTCFGPEQAIDIYVGKIAESMKAINDGADAEVIEKLLKRTVSLKKEINASDIVARFASKSAKHVKKARKLVTAGDMAGATAELQVAEDIANSLKARL
jgi:hypothetical protein